LKATQLQPAKAQESTKDRGYGAYLYAKYLPKFWGLMSKIGIHKENSNRSGLLVEFVEKMTASGVPTLELLGNEVTIAKDDINQHFEIDIKRPAYFKELCEVVTLFEAQPKAVKGFVALLVQASTELVQASKEKPQS